ncbi:mycofactocin precursor MftA [Micromonospora costi]
MEEQTTVADPIDTNQQVAAEALVEADDLVEEVSIDGMCGVY